MHVEWYYEDFSDPEAVSGSSTNYQNRHHVVVFWLFFGVGFILNILSRKNKNCAENPVEKWLKNHTKIVQKTSEKILT
jgi:hypothetical protein